MLAGLDGQQITALGTSVGLVVGTLGKLLLDLREHGRTVKQRLDQLQHDLAGVRLKVDLMANRRVRETDRG